MFRKSQTLVSYEAVSFRLTREGGLALYHVRLDVASRRLVTTLLDEYLLDSGSQYSPTDVLREAVRLLEHRQRGQVPLAR